MPSTIAYRPRSVSELVDAAFTLLRRDYLQYVMLMALAYVPWLVIATAFGLNGRAALQRPFMLFASYVGAMVWFSLVDAVMVIAGSEAYLGRAVDVGGAFNAAFGRLGAVLYASIGKGLAVGIGFILLIVPGFYFLAKYFAVPATVVIEGKSGSVGLDRSAQLSEGLKGHILKTLLLVWVIYILLSTTAGIVAGIFSGGTGAAGTGPLLLTQLISAAFTIFVYPFISLTQTVLYYDARIRREGYDMELMASGLGDSAPARAAL